MSDEIFDQNSKNDLPESMYEPEPVWKRFVLGHKKILYAAAGLIVIITGLLLWLALSGNHAPGEPVSSNVLLKIKGPAQITAGNEGDYIVALTNGEEADLANVSLEVFYPASFKFKSADPQPTASTGQRFNLPILKKGDSASVKIKGQVSGSSGEIKEFRAKLSYSLSNFNSTFEVSDEFTTLVLPPNLNVEITGPIDATTGQDTTFTVNYSNVAGAAFENLAVIVTYPAGFKFALSVPVPGKNNNYWVVPKLDVGMAGKIEITGSFQGNTLADQIVSVELGQTVNNTFASLINSSTVFKTMPSSLSLALKSNPKDQVSLGENIEYTLEYGNYGTIGLTNLTISVTLQGTALDLSRLNIREAIVTNNVITWKSATLSNLSLLAPNQKGQITFSVPVKTSLNTNIKNQVISASGLIYSAEVPKPIHIPDVQIKLRSSLDLTVSGEYLRGALPMKVGEATTYALTFVLSNLSNDLESVEVVASLPLPASAWKNVAIPDSEKGRISYDAGSGKIKWKIDKMAAFVGKFTPALLVSFEVEVVPTEADRGKTVDLLTNIQASGKDMFVNQGIFSAKVNEVDTGNIEDDEVNLKGSTVQ